MAIAPDASQWTKTKDTKLMRTRVNYDLDLDDPAFKISMTSIS